MAERWYNSTIASGIGAAAIITAFFFGGAAIIRGCSDALNSKEQLQMKKYEDISKLYEADLDNNGVLDKFYIIDGKIAVVELNGRSLFSSLDTKVLEKEK